MTRLQQLDKLHARLVLKREALQRALKGDLSLLNELHQAKTGDSLDAAADTITDEINSQIAEVESRELQAIDDAIDRYEAGTFGDCQSCGKPIPITRLRALPFASDCIDCRRAEESRIPGMDLGTAAWGYPLQTPGW